MNTDNQQSEQELVQEDNDFQEENDFQEVLCLHRFIMLGRLEEALFELSHIKISFLNIPAQMLRLILHWITVRLKKKIVITPFNDVEQFNDLTDICIKDILELCDFMRKPDDG